MWIASFYPQLPLDLAFRRWPEALQENLRATVPLVITESKRVAWVSRCAEECGIVPGMSESGARTRSANVMLVPRDIEAEEKALTEAALWALHFTPEVSLRPAGLLLLDFLRFHYFSFVSVLTVFSSSRIFSRIVPKLRTMAAVFSQSAFFASG